MFACILPVAAFFVGEFPAAFGVLCGWERAVASETMNICRRRVGGCIDGVLMVCSGFGLPRGCPSKYLVPSSLRTHLIPGVKYFLSLYVADPPTIYRNDAQQPTMTADSSATVVLRRIYQMLSLFHYMHRIPGQILDRSLI